VPRIKPGEPVEVTVEAVQGLKVNGVVERISPQATIKNNIKGYPARIVLHNVDSRVRPGMTANVRIPVASAANVTAVPLEAVFTEKNPDSEQMERFVYVQHGEGYEKRNVKVGIADFFYAEIQDGLSPGDVVALEMPKEELEKQTQQLANQRGNPEPGARGTKVAAPAPATRTNATPPVTTPKAIPAATQTGGRTAAGSS
jgi:HlyD family secretion protein